MSRSVLIYSQNFHAFLIKVTVCEREKCKEEDGTDSNSLANHTATDSGSFGKFNLNRDV